MSSHWCLGAVPAAPGLERVLPGLALSSKGTASATIPINREPASWLGSFTDRLTPPSTSCPPSPPIGRQSRQPPKSKYALWVGNLPPKSTLIELCQLFGTMELISVYLIHRTGCAFVNYSTLEALEEAIELFSSRGGKIRDHKLVIKAQKPDFAESPKPDETPDTYGGDRYFICKALTADDLEAAKTSSQWSTQVHNRAKFNAAFSRSDNVYFIFSANRTSSFYGYARMISPIPDVDLDAANSPVNDDTHVVAVPAYNKNGVQYPAGNIVEDANRGCLFWESAGHKRSDQERDDVTNQWTAPCNLEWLSGESQVMFSRTRQIRNPLNANKPVKVARDGTEIDPAVGRTLIALF